MSTIRVVDSSLPFISTWRTTNTSTGSTANNQVRLPLISTGTYNFVVNWGDGNEDTITVWNQAETTHTYAATGDYTITITGTLTGWAFSNTKDRLKILNVSQWGSVKLGPIDVFRGCSNLNFTATDIPDLSLTNMAGFFDGCASLTGNSSINDWNVTGKTGFESCFLNCSNFNQPLGNWDMSSATRLFALGRAGMFGNCTIFNQDLSSWDVSNVVDFRYVFVSCSAFNQSIDNWDVSSATNMSNMFFGSGYNQPLNSWDVSSVTQMVEMFRASAFNKPLSNWNVSSVTSMGSMFLTNSAFNQDIGGWDVGLVTTFGNFMSTKTPSTFSTTNLDAIYNGWTNRSLQTARAITFGTAKYTAAATAARALLTRANATVSVTNAVNNGSGLIRITTGAAHGRTTGDKIFISGVTGTTEANGGWIVTVIDATTVDLQASTLTNTYVSGGTFRTGYGWAITDGGL